MFTHETTDFLGVHDHAAMAEFGANAPVAIGFELVTDRFHLGNNKGIACANVAWEAFHLEVADLIKNGQMPQKKEAAIQLMMSWFENTQKQKPSRSAVSEKLTPYYRRFFSARD